MAKEIERKFRVLNIAFKEEAIECLPIRQCYLSHDAEGYTIRVRIAANKAFLTIKSVSSLGGLLRNEWEYPIPPQDAEEIMRGRVTIEKKRFLVPYKGHMWEVDCFSGSLEGLVLAEVELKSQDEDIALPPWVGEEVTCNPAYYNAVLATKGFPTNEKRIQ